MKIGRFLNLKQVSEVLKISETTVRRRVSSGKLRSFKEGGRVLVLEADLEDYLRRQYGEPFEA